ncbi:hypothetical protein, partial [Ekhidna sp.]|uniref:beta strand repeat-containing protein n=1 Tax=Ekhidna sp. TaxID=2608089 RepID=UPI0032986B77
MKRLTILFYVLVVLLGVEVNAQTKGLIYKPADGGKSVLDPNLDGYVSKTDQGFTSTDDETESEIPYVPLPVFGAGEPDSDNSAGPSCGFVDLVRSAENETIYTYSNSTNLLFRFRLGGTAENSKGYTILVDTDGLFGNGSDPDYTTGNPGFEYEITLRTNFGVSIYDIDNNTLTSTEIGDGTVDRPYDDFAQKAIAGSEICGTDYFYDFYVPYADLPFDSSTPVRMVGGTTIAPKNSTGFKMADLGGIDDDTGVTDDLFEDLIDIYPPTSGDDVSSGGTIDPRAECPLIDGPIGVDDTSISGTTSEADGATIELFRDGVSQGTTLATGGTWSFSGLAAAVAGEVFIATAKVGETAANATGTSKKSTSFSDCDATTVGAVCSDPIDFAASTFSISNRGLCATGASGITGAKIKIYYNGSSTPRTDADTGSSGGVAGEVTVDGSGGWNFKCNTNTNCGSGGPNCGFPTTGVFGITQTETGKCESEIVYYCVGITNSATPTITTSPITTSTTSITGFATTGAIVELYIDDVATGTTFTAASNAYTLSLPTVTVGQSISVYATESGNCPTQSAATLVTNAPVQSAAPIIEGEYCGATTSISGVTASGSGTTIQVYKSSTSGGSYIAEGSSIVTTGASWTVSGLSLSVGEFVVAKATGSGETESDFSNEIEILSQTTDVALSITNPASPNEIRAGDASISGKGTPGNTVFLYLDGFIVDETTYFAVVDGLGDWTISGLDAASAGYDVLYAEAVATVTSKSGALCESDPSAGETVLCELPDNSMTFSATSATTICAGETIDFSVSTTENLVVYELIDQLGNGVGPAALGDGNSLSLTTYAIDETVTSISLVASRIGVTCEQTVGTITVSPEQINLTHVITQQPNNCLSPDGVITLSGLNNNQTYTLDYKVDGVAATTTTPTSNGSGEIAISGLGPGEYSDITITGTAITLTCGNVIDGPVVLTNVASPVLTLGAVTIPGTCGATTGSIALTSSLTGSIITYTINYLDDGVPKTATENADLSGNILLSGLDAGVYANINIVPPSGCKSNSVGPVTIADPDPTILISGSSNPLACGGNGSINLSFTDFTDGTYEIFYDGGSFPGVNVASNAASISASAGSYVNLRATESATGCLTDEDPDVTLSDPATHTIAATRTNPTTCGGNGSVNFTFTGVPDNTYTINYDGGSFTGVSVTSNTASVSAPAGIYSNLSISVSGCTSSDFPSVTLTEPADPLAPTVTFDGSYCVGDVIVAPTTSGSSLQWYSDAGLITTIATVDPANPTNAELGFSSATANTTTVYVTQTVNSCESNGTAVSLIVSDPVTITLGSISYPSCGSTDGNIQLTGLANNTTYQVDFSKDGAGVIRNSTSDGTGNILLTNLGGGSYTNISVSLDGCQSNTLTGPVKLIDASTSGGIIINEASNGSAGSEDWVELLVIGDANNPTANVDISGWYFDDNNGDFESATGTGVASGSLFFGSSWNSVPPGSLIIIYNQSDKDTSIGTDDPDDTGTPDGVYILPGNHSSLEGCSSSSYDCSPGVTTASWSRVAFRNDGDAVQVRMPNGDFYHGFSYGDVTAPFPTFPCGGSSFNAGTGGAGSTFSLGCGDWTNSANYSDAEARSPGASNPSNNATLIAKISNGSFDYSNYSAAANCAASGPTSSVISGDATICVGGSTNVVVAITGGTSPYTVVLSDGTSINNYISGSNISVSPSSTTAYTITSVTDDNSNAGTGNSGSATVTVNADPNITAQPSSVTECVGTSTTLSVTAAGGASGLTYQWQSST